MTLARRIAVLKGGRSSSSRTPGAVYDRPANLFVAEFIGSPSINCFEATRDDDGALRLGNGQLIGRADGVAAGKLIVGVRPEDLSLRDGGDDGDDAHSGEGNGAGTLRGSVALVEPTGPETYALVDLGVGEATVRWAGCSA